MASDWAPHSSEWRGQTVVPGSHEVWYPEEPEGEVVFENWLAWMDDELVPVDRETHAAMFAASYVQWLKDMVEDEGDEELSLDEDNGAGGPAEEG